MPIERTRAEQTHALACATNDAERRAVIQDERHRRVVITDDESLADYKPLPTHCEVGPPPIVGPYAVKPAAEPTPIAPAELTFEERTERYQRATEALRAAGCYAFVK